MDTLKVQGALAELATGLSRQLPDPHYDRTEVHLCAHELARLQEGLNEREEEWLREWARLWRRRGPGESSPGDGCKG